MRFLDRANGYKVVLVREDGIRVVFRHLSALQTQTLWDLWVPQAMREGTPDFKWIEEPDDNN